MNRTVTAVLIVVILALFGGGIYGAVTLNHKIDDLSGKLKVSQEKVSSANFTRKCSEDAANFYSTTGQQSIGAFKSNDNSYTNHWNRKLEKCFIQMNFAINQNNFLDIEVYDVTERKHFASYTGQYKCFMAKNRCLYDQGIVFLRGEDNPGPDDIQVGFNVGKGKIGTDKTKQEFLDNVRMFMEN